ncbi:MAG: hypothetical protein ABWZ25_19475 [Chitinophagaceae bacterium]
MLNEKFPIRMLKRVAVMRVLILCFLFSGCNIRAEYKSIKLDKIEDISSNILGRPIEKIKDESFILGSDSLFIRDTLFISEEDVSWPGLVFFDNIGDVFLVETSWVDRNIIVWAAVLSPRIKTKNQVCVGTSFSRIKPYIRFDSWKEFPDGYIAFKDSLDNRIVYSIDVGGDSYLYSSDLSLSSFPDTLKVENVMLQ